MTTVKPTAARGEMHGAANVRPAVRLTMSGTDAMRFGRELLHEYADAAERFRGLDAHDLPQLRSIRREIDEIDEILAELLGETWNHKLATDDNVVVVGSAPRLAAIARSFLQASADELEHTARDGDFDEISDQLANVQRWFAMLDQAYAARGEDL